MPKEYKEPPGFSHGEHQATMFMILGRYCGLDIGVVVYDAPNVPQHCYNTVILENSEIRCIDVLWDDILHDSRYFMEAVEANLVSHPR